MIVDNTTVRFVSSGLGMRVSGIGENGGKSLKTKAFVFGADGTEFYKCCTAIIAKVLAYMV